MSTVDTTLDDLIADFAFLDDWEDRYRHVIELGKALPPLADRERTDANKVRGCASQVWLISDVSDDGQPVLRFRGDSDAHIVRGLIAVLFTIYSGRTAHEILSLDAESIFKQLGLREHLTAQRSNGLTSMVHRIRSDAEAALAGAVN